MAITITADPIFTVEDAQSIFDVSEEQGLIILINALSVKFLRYTNRVAINHDTVEEWIRGDGSPYLWLHGAPVDTGETVVAEVRSQGNLIVSYSLAAEEFRVESNDDQAALDLAAATWPHFDSNHVVKVSYTGGWTAVPGDVIQGAIMQGRLDLQRVAGLIGISSISRQGESTSYESDGLAKAVREMWRPYQVIV